MTAEPKVYSYTWFNPLDFIDDKDTYPRPAIEIRTIVRPEPGEYQKIRWMLERALQDMVALMQREDQVAAQHE